MTEAQLDELFKTNPSRYFFIRAKEQEKILDYKEAAHFYVCAHNSAKRDKLVTALRYKWEAIRCVEMDDIKTRLKSLVDPVTKVGLIEGDNITVYWGCAEKVIPVDKLNKARNRVLSSYSYQLIKYNKVTEDITFIKAFDIFTDSEPRIGGSITVTKEGTTIELPPQIDPPILRHKWAVMDSNSAITDRVVSMKRDIKIEYLKIPEHLKKQSSTWSFFSKNVLPCIGNRSIGKVAKITATTT